MLIGVPKEIKTHENRVGLTPSSVKELTSKGHEVIIQSHAGEGAGFTNTEYGMIPKVTIVSTASQVFDAADMIVKVKEPQQSEIDMLKPNHILFTYLHLAADKAQTDGLIKSGATCIAYETITDSNKRLPLLTPMSEVAGRMSIQVGAHYLEKHQGGRGILLGGVPGVESAKVTVIGGGVAGSNAAQMAIGMGAKVSIIDKSLSRLKELDNLYGNRISTLYSTTENIEKEVTESDLVIGSVLIPGASAPKLVTEDMVKAMKPGSVMVDIAVDQGGCFETTHPTSHSDPVYLKHDVIHYCVTNMPGAVPRTSTIALNNATLPYVIELAGCDKSTFNQSNFYNGLNIHNGMIMHPAVAKSLNL